MITRASSALAFLLGGCTIHVVEAPTTPVAASPAPTLVVAEAPRPRPEPARVRHERPQVAEPASKPQRPAPDKNTPPARADLDPVRPAQKPPQPHVDKPLYTPFRDVGPRALPPKLTTGDSAEPRRRKVKKTGT